MISPKELQERAKSFRGMWLMRNSNQVGRTAQQLRKMIEEWIDMGCPALSRIEVISVEAIDLRKELTAAQAEGARLRERLRSSEFEVTRLHDALEMVLNQPFKGDWDAQAVFVSEVLMVHRRHRNAATPAKEGET